MPTRLNIIDVEMLPAISGVRALPPLVIALGSLLFTIACASLQVPSKIPAVTGAGSVQTKAADIDLVATPITDAGQYLELFDDNLPEIGIVVAVISMRNTGSLPLDISPNPWFLRIAGRQIKALSSDKLLEHYYRQRRIRAYAVRADEEARQGISKSIFHDGTLSPAASRSGLIFFKLDPNMTSKWPSEATLLGKGLSFADGRKISLELSLAHGSP